MFDIIAICRVLWLRSLCLHSGENIEVIRNKEVVKRVSKLLCAFEAWNLWLTISKNIKGLFPSHSKAAFLEVAVTRTFILLMMYQNFYYKRIRTM